MRKLLPLLLCAVTLCFAQYGGRRAPGWALPDSKMNITDLADFRGKYVLLEFMQTNCPHCAAFADVLKQAEQRYGAKVQVIAVVKAPEDNAATVGQYVAGHGVNYPVLFDAGQMMYSYLRSNQMTFPHLYVIDPGGTIVRDWTYGLTTRDIFEGKGLLMNLDAIINKK